MNDEFTDLENELRGLRPRATSRQLEDQIGAFLDHHRSERNATTWWQWLGFNRAFAAVWWGALSPALTAALVIIVMRPAEVTRSPSPLTGHSSVEPAEPATQGFLANLKSTKASNVLYEALDEGVVLDAGQEPVHRVRYRSADLVQWRNPATGANWEVSYPREDVVLVPVQAQ